MDIKNNLLDTLQVSEQEKLEIRKQIIDNFSRDVFDEARELLTLTEASGNNSALLGMKLYERILVKCLNNITNT
jgi:hypothetical protein